MNIEDCKFGEKTRAVIDAFLELRKAVDLIDDEEMRATWAMSIAGDFLHDMPDDLRKKFFEDYEQLRRDVIEVCGH